MAEEGQLEDLHTKTATPAQTRAEVVELIASHIGENEKDKPDGKRLLQKLGIPQLRSPVSDMYLFSVRVADSGYHMLVKYCDVLAEWKQEHLITQ